MGAMKLEISASLGSLFVDVAGKRRGRGGQEGRRDLFGRTLAAQKRTERLELHPSLEGRTTMAPALEVKSLRGRDQQVPRALDGWVASRDRDHGIRFAAARSTGKAVDALAAFKPLTDWLVAGYAAPALEAAAAFALAPAEPGTLPAGRTTPGAAPARMKRQMHAIFGGLLLEAAREGRSIGRIGCWCRAQRVALERTTTNPVRVNATKLDPAERRQDVGRGLQRLH